MNAEHLNAFSCSLKFSKISRGVAHQKIYNHTVYLPADWCVLGSGLRKTVHTHTRRKRKSLLNTLQGSTWDKIQQHWIIHSIYQGENTNPDKRTHTHTYIYSTLGGLLGSEGALVSVVIYQNMWFKVPWQAKPSGLYLCKFFPSLWTLQHIMPDWCASVM